MCEAGDNDGWGDSAWGDSKGPRGKPPRGRRNRRTNNPLALIRRQAVYVAPEECYPVYNAAAYQAERAGRVYSELCVSDSPFKLAIRECTECQNEARTVATSTYTALQSQLDWCDSQPEATATPTG